MKKNTKKKAIKQNNFIKSGKLYLVLLFVSVLFLSVGYAAVSSISLEINGTAQSDTAKGLLITNVTYQSNTNADLDNCAINDFYQTVLDSTIALNNDKYSDITYQIRIENRDTEIKKYKETIYDPSFYDNNDITFEVNGLDQTVILEPGDSVTFTITFKYAEEKADYPNTVLNSYINFKFDTANYVAKIGTTYFETIYSAIQSVTTSNQTTIEILKDVTEANVIPSGRNLIINVNGHTIRNTNNTPIFDSSGTLTLNNGTLLTDGEQAAVNCFTTSSVLYINDMTIRSTGQKQAVYSKGYTEITNTEISAVSTIRGALGIDAGTTIVHSGKISNPNFYGIQNKGTVIIGDQGGEISQSNPEIIGGTNGVNTTNSNVTFYDGVVKSPNMPFNNESRVTTMETGYEIAHGEDTIEGVFHNTGYPAQIAVVTFNYNGGTASEANRKVEINKKIQTLPVTERVGYDFVGWYTDNTGGDLVTPDTIITADIPIYARWQKQDVATYNGQIYNTIQGAINATPNNSTTPATITLINDARENFKVGNNKNVILDLNGHTVSIFSNKCVIENNGTITVQNGTLTSSGDKEATINNKSGGVLNLAGGSITNSTSTRQAVYNKAGGTVNIYGTAYLTSITTGIAAEPATIERGTVQNESGGVVNITGGTIECSTQHAISNEGTLTIGVKDGSISTTSPALKAEQYAILNKAGSTLNIYDGSFKGKSGVLNGSYTELETNTHLTNTMDGAYHSSVLEND